MNTQRTKKKTWNSPVVPFRMNDVLRELWKRLRGEKKREEWLRINAYHMIGTRRNGKVCVCVCDFTGTKENLIKTTFHLCCSASVLENILDKMFSTNAQRFLGFDANHLRYKDYMKRLFRHNFPYANHFISSLYAYNEKKTFCWNLKNRIKHRVKSNYSFLSFWLFK